MEANDTQTPALPPIVVGAGEAPPPANDGHARFFRRVDWISFVGTTAVVLAVYLYTLAPEVTLEMSGVLSAAAMYGGVAHPPGFPVWTIYAWVFTKLLPFSNIAWRIAVSSAVAGALTCGVIALMVSRGGEALLEGISGLKRLEEKEERWLRIVCGAVAGMAFGFNGTSWGMAVVVDTRALSNLLFTVVLCLLLRWSYRPERIRWLYAAFFAYGLTVSASQVFVLAALGLPFFVMFIERKLGRDLLFAAAVLATGIVIANRYGWFPQLSDGGGNPNLLWSLYFYIGALTGGAGIWQIIKTRSFLTRWWQAVIAGSLSLLGAAMHFYLPVASMTNPPVNWGYPRTVEGFFHQIERGQFERFSPTPDSIHLLVQLFWYVVTAVRKLGLVYLLVGLVPIWFWRRIARRERGILVGFFCFFLCLSVLMLILLNPPAERGGSELAALFYPPAYLILALFAGHGLVLVGTVIGQLRIPRLAGWGKPA